ncbi:MAG: DoxX family protein [Gemmatimonadetes bacterium]|nr:DoxX family protein [Gemmatimonadota bacterium]
MHLTERAGLAALRVLIALQLVIHGSYRALSGGVLPFGGWLTDQQGIPFGTVLAIGITAVEIVGGLTLIAGRLVRPLTAWFALQLLGGIWLVHRPEGWFVVGGGRNGMEYSVVLIGCLVLIGLTARPGETQA